MATQRNYLTKFNLWPLATACESLYQGLKLVVEGKTLRGAEGAIFLFGFEIDFMSISCDILPVRIFGRKALCCECEFFLKKGVACACL